MAYDNGAQFAQMVLYLVLGPVVVVAACMVIAWAYRRIHEWIVSRP